MGDEESKTDYKIAYYWAAGIILLIIGYWLFNQRGGTFLVYACNESTSKCYTLKANLSAEFRGRPQATLLFNNGGSLHIDCNKEEGTCLSDEGDSWSLKKIERQ